MTTNYPTTLRIAADSLDPTLRFWINDGLLRGCAPNHIASLLGTEVCNVTAVFHTDMEAREERGVFE
jgi:hypothetical protein